MTRYANTTHVTSEKSRIEIERTLGRYGAEEFAYGIKPDMAMIGFRMNGRMVRFRVPLPSTTEGSKTPTGRLRKGGPAQAAFEQAVRQRWRALLLVIKAKLEAVDSGITSFDEEFLAHLVLPNGKTVGDFMLPQVEIAYDKGKMPRLLLS